MIFGHVVTGPPSSGKSTYISEAKRFLKSLPRKVVTVNLDPANDFVSYEPDINIMDLITVEDVMEYFGIGPNESLLYCMRMLDYNVSWLEKEMKEFEDTQNPYFIFDCPGQSELFTHDSSLANLFGRLCRKNSDYQFSCLHMIDIQYLCDPSNFIMGCMNSLIEMLHLKMPHVNAISKYDLFPTFYEFNMDYYSKVMNLTQLVERLHLQSSNPYGSKMKKFYNLIAEKIDDRSLDQKSLHKIIVNLDKANGLIFKNLLEHDGWCDDNHVDDKFGV